MRKPKEYEVRQAGDLVQLDTLDIRPLPGIIYKHFTTHDVTSKWNVVSVYRRATATTVTQFLDALEERMPFLVKAIQVDGGAEFEAFFMVAWNEPTAHTQRSFTRLPIAPLRLNI